MIGLTAYLITAFLWAVFALKMNHKLFGYNKVEQTICFLLNFIFCPIALFLAIKDLKNLDIYYN